MSSTRIQSRSATSPIICITCDTFARGRRLSIIAISVSFNNFATARARTTPPISGETTIGLTRSVFFKISSSKTGEPNTLSTGTSKKPWICSACKSQVNTRSIPTVESKSATTFAVIGTRAERTRRS